ncbi:MAG: lactate utilization protein B/C [Chitinophagia bacterium]|nr:lactate utilization protein B/C [Chitinophagia bacterium]
MPYNKSTFTAKENILMRIRRELESTPMNVPYPEVEKDNSSVFEKQEGTLLEIFAQNFEQTGGQLTVCRNEADFLTRITHLCQTKQWQNVISSDTTLGGFFSQFAPEVIKQQESSTQEADACITGCELLIARTGSVLCSSMQNMGRTSTIYYPAHIIVAWAEQVVYDLEDAFAALKARYGNSLPSMLSFHTGPSRTADIEKTLVVGVHGPQEVHLFLLKKE